MSNEAVEKLDVESLIVDLLACGLGGVIILFFIFSIKIIGSASAKTLSISDDKDRGKNAGFVSLIGDDGQGKSMGAIRIVRLSNLSKEEYNTLEMYVERPDNFWDLTEFKQTPKLNNSLRLQVQKKEGEIAFFIYGKGMRKVDFKFPKELISNPGWTSPDRMVDLEVLYVEGNSMIGDFKGAFSKKWSIPSNELFNKLIKLNIGKFSNINRLIEISTNK